MEKNDKISKLLKKIPKNPGCYRFYDKSGRLLYIGKAKNLKKRVSSYFQKDHLDPKTKVLVGKIADVKWEITDSEMEALILESQLIKKFMPRFNIKIKDDKSFLYVKIDLKQKYPRPEFVRRPQKNAEYNAERRGKIKFFGPFTDSGLLKDGMTALRKIFKWCEMSEGNIAIHQKKHKPCFDYQIGYCSGICAGKVSIEYYVSSIRHLILFLEGKKKRLISDLKKEMAELSRTKDFEKAAVVRDKIRALEGIGTALRAVSSKSKFLISNKPPNHNDKVLDNIIKEVNAKTGSKLRLKKDFRIEFYDISNTGGTEAVGSMVVWQNDELARSEYRKFKIKTAKKQSDVDYMREVLVRRLARIKNYESRIKEKAITHNSQLILPDNQFWPKPDLVILDGGKPQLRAIIGLFQEKGIDIPLLGLAKEEEKVWGIADCKLQIANLRFKELDIAKNSPEGHFIQRIRDEAHRFAISFHKNLRTKRTIRSRLDEVSGIGPVTRKKLLSKYGSVKGIMEADMDELEKTVGAKMAKRLKEKL